ncbi:hypothetical protein GMORB2_2633 [Geosmithia morbida]|uniref:Uncharacterized protein n=1 Tax=Geosmithia morbida TaxID=1094350 RepID=A0A9P4YQ08_9HYPO|nr:uncharacterized protein GMORB2_2633 [Geosmithia morbida]KAF4120630.1 hypothetical protein GMORB2_2633 [Geosmithia morbida]
MATHHSPITGLGVTLQPVDSSVSQPERAGLSRTTTAYDPLDKSPRPSGESTPKVNPFETDIEAMDVDETYPYSKTKQQRALDRTDKQVWPGKDHWKQVAKSAKMKRSCTCMARLSHRNRIIAKILIVILVVGAAVGIGFGVSKPLGAAIWTDNH